MVGLVNLVGLWSLASFSNRCQPIIHGNSMIIVTPVAAFVFLLHFLSPFRHIFSCRARFTLTGVAFALMRRGGAGYVSRVQGSVC